MDTLALKRAIARLDAILKDVDLDVWDASNLPREEFPTVRELTKKTDIRQQLESSKMAGQDLYFSEKLTKKPNQAYVGDGVVVIIVNNMLFKIPIDDISKISRIKKGDQLKSCMIWLTEGWINIMWQTKESEKKMIAKEMRRRRNARRRGNWYTLK